MGSAGRLVERELERGGDGRSGCGEVGLSGGEGSGEWEEGKGDGTGISSRFNFVI